MAFMSAEEWGDLPLSQSDARERLPQVMAYLGFRRIDEHTWRRRKDRCGSGWWSLPDACPATLHWILVAVDPKEDSPDALPLTRYALSYRVKMPGQILAHTDAKALELEIDRILHLMIGGFDRETGRERGRLVRLTVAANAALSVIPALTTSATALTVYSLTQVPGPPLRWAWTALCGAAAWGGSLCLTARGVVWALNRRVETRLHYRALPGHGWGFFGAREEEEWPSPEFRIQEKGPASADPVSSPEVRS